MAEVRVRPSRKAGQLNFESELRDLLFAHGDDRQPLDETVRVMDSIVTDYIIEICHGAAAVAHYAGRQKVKLEDFRFTFRKDETKLGRMLQIANSEKEQRAHRKAFDPTDDKLELRNALQAAAEALDDPKGDEKVDDESAPKKKRRVMKAEKGVGRGKGKGKS